MAKSTRIFLLLVAGIVLSALLEPWAIKALTAAGWYDDPGVSVGVALNWLSRIVGEGVFPWVAAGTLGLTLGLWLDWLLRKVDKNRRKDMGPLAIAMQAFIPLLDAESHGKEINKQFIEDLMPETKSLLLRCENLRLRTPLGIFMCEPVDTVSFLRVYYSHLFPLLRDGHLKEAKYVARTSCGTFHRLTKARIIENALKKRAQSGRTQKVSGG